MATDPYTGKTAVALDVENATATDSSDTSVVIVGTGRVPKRILIAIHEINEMLEEVIIYDRRLDKTDLAAACAIEKAHHYFFHYHEYPDYLALQRNYIWRKYHVTRKPIPVIRKNSLRDRRNNKRKTHKRQCFKKAILM